MITEKDIENSFKLEARVLKAIKPCPFCGGAAQTRERKAGQFHLFYVQCLCCDANNDTGNLEEEIAILKWNTRHGQPRTKHDELFDKLPKTIFHSAPKLAI